MFTVRYEKKPRVLPPEGVHVARCFWLVDLGTQTTKTSSGHKIWLSFELPYEMHKFKDDEPEQPFSVSTSHFISFGATSKFRKFLQDWRGKPYTDDQVKEGIDLSKFLGGTCQVQVVHNETSTGTYANIQTVMPLGKGQECPPPVNKPVLVSLEPLEFNMRDFDRLPEFLRKMVESSPEWDTLVELGHPDNQFDREAYLAQQGGGDFEKAVAANKKEWDEAEAKHKAEMESYSKPKKKTKEPVIEDKDIDWNDPDKDDSDDLPY